MPIGEVGAIGPGDRVLLTGAAGFVGSALAKALVSSGASVLAPVLSEADAANLSHLPVETFEADLRHPGVLSAAVAGCRIVFHVAALYRFWSKEPADFYETNVGGTLNVLEAARQAGVERVVYTSTVGTIGLESTSDSRPGGSRPAREGDWVRIEHLFGHYKRSKYVAEHEVLRAAAEGLPVVLVHPTMPVGPGDRAPTPTGKTVLDFLNGRFRGYVDTAVNVVDVEDVAAGHLLAAAKGRLGRSYILGGENLSFVEMLGLLAEETGLPAPRIEVPENLVLAAAHLSELVEGRLARRPPSVPLEGARMASTKMIFDDSRARQELGYSSRPARQALRRAATWYAENGYVKSSRLARITWSK